MPLLSIIVPVYNVSRYLAEGLDSLLRQEVRDIEILCVDDCSTDGSLSILESYSQKDSRITVLRQDKNTGVGATRNTGLLQAKGKLIAFFDPDDLVCPNIYSTLIKAFDSSDIDVVFCGFRSFPNGSDVFQKFPSNVALSPRDFLKENKHIHSRNDMCFPWRMMVRHSLLEDNNLRFLPEILRGGDTPFNLACTLHARKVMMIPQALYKYRIDNEGSMKSLRYNPALEQSLELQIAEKKRLIKEFSMDEYTPITKDMSEDIVRRYVPMLLGNVKNQPNHIASRADVSRIINLTLVRDACREVGFRNVFPSQKEYLFYLAVKFRLASVVKRLFFR